MMKALKLLLAVVLLVEAIPARGDSILSAPPHVFSDGSVGYTYGAGKLQLGSGITNGKVMIPAAQLAPGATVGNLGYTPAQLGATYNALIPAQRALGEHGMLATAFTPSPTALCQGPSNDDVVLNQAIDASNANGGGYDLFMRAGSCKVGAPLHALGVGTRVVCESHYTTTFLATAAMNAMMTINAPTGGVYNCGFDLAGLGNIAIDVAKGHEGRPTYVEKNFIKGFLTTAIRISSGSDIYVDYNEVFGNGKYDGTQTCIGITNDGTTSSLQQNRCTGTAGIIQHRGANTTEGLNLIGNVILADGPSLVLDGCLFCISIGNTYNGYVTHPFTNGPTAYLPSVLIESIAGTTKTFSSTNDQISTFNSKDTLNGAAAPAGTCGLMVNGAQNVTFSQDSFVAGANNHWNGCLFGANNGITFRDYMGDPQGPAGVDIHLDGNSQNVLIDGAEYYGAVSVAAGNDTGRMSNGVFQASNPPQVGSRFAVGRQVAGLPTKTRLNIVFTASSPTQKDQAFNPGVWKTPDPSQITATLGSVPGNEPGSVNFQCTSPTNCSMHLANAITTGTANYFVTIDVAD